VESELPPERRNLRKRRNDAEGVRQRALDAAEALLAQRGYYGVTMREVAVEAGMKLGTLTYHFATKDTLFRHVITRRASEYVQLTDKSLAHALDQEMPTTETIIRAYVSPALDLSQNGGSGWKNYMRLLGHAMNNRQDEDFIAPILENFDPLLRRIVDAFTRVHPNAEISKIHMALFFVEAAFIHILVEAGILDRHSNGLCTSSDLIKIKEDMIPFFAAGFDKVVT
jgi:AcrR family transcriptional regulator